MKVTFLNLRKLKVFFLLMLLGWVSCSEKEKHQDEDLTGESQMFEKINQALSELPTEVVTYYDNIKTMMYATNAFERPKKNKFFNCIKFGRERQRIEESKPYEFKTSIIRRCQCR